MVDDGVIPDHVRGLSGFFVVPECEGAGKSAASTVRDIAGGGGKFECFIHQLPLIRGFTHRSGGFIIAFFIPPPGKFLRIT